MLLRVVLLASCTVLMAAAPPSASARKSFDRGEAALAAGKLDQAESAYREALTRTPGYAAAINGLGSVLFKKGQRDQALAQFRAATEADSSFALAFFNLGFAARKAGDHAAAAQAYERYSVLVPADPDGFLGLADSYRALGEHPKAVAAYEAFIAREKRPSEAQHVARAQAAIAELNQPPAGRSDLTSSAGTVPNPSLSAERLAAGDRLHAEKRLREAAFAYLDAANANPDSSESHFKLASTYAQLGYYEQAIQRWSRVLEMKPELAIERAARDNIARAQAKLTTTPAGLSPVEAAPVSESARKAARSAYERGVERITRRDYSGAASSLTEAIQLEPTLTVAFVARGSAYIGLRRYPDAVSDYQFALRLDPSLSAPLYGLGESYRALGRRADAKSAYARYAESTSADVRPELQKDAREKASRLQ